jgi:hypothetical protein
MIASLVLMIAADTSVTAFSQWHIEREVFAMSRLEASGIA